MEETADGILVPRRRPAQQRSREKFRRILASARLVLVDVGFESFTFDEVARRASVPIGTLYQYFANKYVMVCELDRQDSASMVAAVRTFSERVPTPQWPVVLDEFIDHLADLWLSDPSRRAVWHAVQSTPATRTTAALTEREVCEAITEVLQPLWPQLPLEERNRMAGVLVHTLTSLLNYAVREADRGEDTFDTIIEETKRMLVAYLFSVATA